MNQKKVGLFVKELRKEKGLTQEQLAEQLNVSNRSVSRWENGNNLPDISILVELADFYDVDIREIIDGERKSENMNEEMKDTLEKVAQYGEYEKEQIINRMNRNCKITLLSLLVVYVIFISPDLPNISVLVQFASLVIAIGAIFENLLYASNKKRAISKDGSKITGKFIWPIVIAFILSLMIVIVSLVGLRATYPSESLWQLLGHFF